LRKLFCGGVEEGEDVQELRSNLGNRLLSMILMVMEVSHLPLNGLMLPESVQELKKMVYFGYFSEGVFFVN